MDLSIPGIKSGVESFWHRSVRVLRVSYRPKEKEFWQMAKTTAAGMVLIGLLGFIITIVFSFI